MLKTIMIRSALLAFACALSVAADLGRSLLKIPNWLAQLTMVSTPFFSGVRPFLRG